MDLDQVDRDLTFNFGTRDYKGVTVKRSLLQSGGFATTDSHKSMLKTLKAGNEQIQIYHSTFIKSSGKPHSTLCVFHGLGEHSQRYNAMCWYFANEGYAVHTVDFRPFGRSGGPKASIYSLGEYHEDIIACLKTTNTDLPQFLFAHSMGGGALTTFLVKNPNLKVAGVILSAPFLRMDKQRQNMSEFDQSLVKALRYSLGKLYTSPDIGASHLFRREGAYETLHQDTKMFPLMTTNSAIVMFEISDTTLSHEREKQLKINAPLLVLYGKKDVVVRGEFTRKFFENVDVGSHVKKIHCFEDGLHEPHQDYERDEYLQTMKVWLEGEWKNWNRLSIQVDFTTLKVGPTVLPKNNLKRNLLILALIVQVLYLFRRRIKKRLMKWAFKFIMWYNS